MPGPKKPGIVSGYPILTAFALYGVIVSGEISLSVEKMEAIRLGHIR